VISGQAQPTLLRRGDLSVTEACFERHRHQEFLKFLKQVAKAYPRVKLHVVVDNYATHKHPAVKAWLTRNPRITLHFTPTSGSWLNMVELFFSILSRRLINRGVFSSADDMVSRVMAFIADYNRTAKPFRWTYDGSPLRVA